MHAIIVPIKKKNFFFFFLKNFMIQGGDPTGTGKGGSSIYG